MLLGERISVLALCQCSGSPETTAARWIRKLENDGWLVRHQDSQDRRRNWVRLSEKGLTSMQRYFALLSRAVESVPELSRNSSIR
ncbi:winged helix DNA-binding protein [Sphingomonas arenae]|uniref:winged helix DNA-binding protein n=1 Tax=Sphingomonas arenae TaxID=2812555 RepID=UPI003AF77574